VTMHDVALKIPLQFGQRVRVGLSAHAADFDF
jgi:hypothetical protein